MIVVTARAAIHLRISPEVLVASMSMRRSFMILSTVGLPEMMGDEQALVENKAKHERFEGLGVKGLWRNIHCPY